MTIGGVLDVWLLGCGGTPVSSVLDSLSDRTAKWFGEAKDELSPSGVWSGPLLGYGLGAWWKSCMSTPDNSCWLQELNKKSHRKGKPITNLHSHDCKQVRCTDFEHCTKHVLLHQLLTSSCYTSRWYVRLIIYPVAHKEEMYKTLIFVSNRASNNRTKIDADSESKEYMKQQYCKSSSYKCSREMKKNHKLEQVEDGYQSRDVIQKW